MTSASDEEVMRPLEEAEDPGISTSPARTSFFWRALRFCNTFAVSILSIVVIALFVQLQVLTGIVKQEQDQINDLQEQVQNQQAGQIEELTHQVEQEHSLTLYQMAGTFTLLTSLLTMFHMSTHLRSYNEPIVQRKVIAILWMSPIYCITSFLSLLFPSADGYLAVIKDFYEAYVIYNFLSFLIAVLGRGDREAVVKVLERHEHLDPPMRLLRCFYHPPPESSDHAKANAVLLECQILCLQFVFVRPVTSIAGFVASSLSLSDEQQDGDDDPFSYFKSPNFYIAMVTNVSVFLAFTGLLKFYHAVRDDLAWLQPFSKFMSIKGIVFLTFWQGLLISIIVNTTANGGSFTVTQPVDATNATTTKTSSTETHHSGMTPGEEAARIQNILICLEMLFFAIAHWCVFPADEWDEGYRPKQYAKPGIGLGDFVSDMSYIVSSSRQRRAAQRDESSSSDLVLEEEDEQEENGVSLRRKSFSGGHNA